MKKLVFCLVLVVFVSALFAEVAITKIWEEPCGMILAEAGTSPLPDGHASDYFRGMAVYDNFLLVVRRDVPEVKFYSIEDGSELTGMSLSLTGVQASNYGISRAMFAEDGALYAANLVVQVDGEDPVLHGPFRVYRWADVDADPELIYENDFDGIDRMRLGDGFTVRGAGEDTKILVSGNHVDSHPVLIEREGGAWVGSIKANPVQGIDLYLNEDGTFWRSVYSSSVSFQKFDETGASIDGSEINLGAIYNPPAIAAFTIDEEADIIYTIGLRRDVVGDTTYHNNRVIGWNLNGVPVFDSEPFEINPDRAGFWNGTGAMRFDADGNLYVLLERHGVARYDIELVTSATTWTLFH